MPNNAAKSKRDPDIALYEREREKWAKAKERMALDIRSEDRMGMPLSFGAGKRRHPCALSSAESGQVCSADLVLLGGYRVCTMHANLVGQVVSDAKRGRMPRRAPKPAPAPRLKARKYGCRTGGSTLALQKLDADAAKCRRRSA